MVSKPLTYDLENAAGSRLQPKAIYAGDAFQGQPSVVVTDSEAIVAGNSSNVINVSSQFGVLLSGKLSLSAMPDQISIGGGYWRLNPMLLSCLPSTTPTPIPVLIKSTPNLFQASSDISSVYKSLMANSNAVG
jgi:hypothetical protein